MAAQKMPTISALDRHLVETAAGWIRLFHDQVTEEDSHRHRREWAKRLVREGRKSILWLLEKAHESDGGIDADTALRELAGEIHEAHQPLPRLVEAYLISRPKPSRRRGRDRGAHMLRDQCIATCVAAGLETWPFLPFVRNEASTGPSV
jgi:hypothetical protein